MFRLYKCNNIYRKRVRSMNYIEIDNICQRIQLILFNERETITISNNNSRILVYSRII